MKLRITAPVCFLFCLLLFAFISPGKGKKPNKTIYDSVFAVGDIIRLPKIAFLPSPDYGRMNKNTKDSLNIVGDFLLNHSNISVDLVNYTDYLGSFNYNNQMSQERARACVKYLVSEKLVPQSRITAKGAGEYFLLADETEVERAKTKEERKALHEINVRTELVVTKIDAEK
jgi:hypothetical protein